MTTRKITTKVIAKSATTYVGRTGEIFYDTATATLRLGNGATAGGISFSGGAPASSLVNGSYTVALGGDGTLTLPSGGAIDGNFVGSEWLDVWLTAPEGATKTAGIRDFFGKTVAVANENYFLIETNRAVSTRSWTFGTDGTLTLPTGAAIRDTAGGAVAFGRYAGLTTQGNESVAIGFGAGKTTQGQGAVAVGFDAGKTTQGGGAVAIGNIAGTTTQGTAAVAVGTAAGLTTQGAGAVAVGFGAGQTSQGAGAVAIGQGAGATAQGARSIIINASGAALNQTTTDTFTVKPVRDGGIYTGMSQAGFRPCYYNPTTGEFVYASS